MASLNEDVAVNDTAEPEPVAEPVEEPEAAAVDGTSDEEVDAVAPDEPVPTVSMARMRPRIDRLVRRGFPGNRVSAKVSGYIVTVLEGLCDEIVNSADAQRRETKKPVKRINRLHLIAGVRKNKCVGKLFRPYQFTATSHLKLNSDLLLTKADRATAKAKRLEAKAARAEKAALPSVDES